MARIIAPLAGWNVRGYSYGELQPDGNRHPGADLNVGYGDDDLGLPVVAFADGIAAGRIVWDGHTHGFGNAALVEHRLFATLGAAGGATGGDAEGIRLWSLYAHLDEFAPSFLEGAPVSAGDPIGTCGKSGGQRWAHLHFELRYKGPPEMPVEYWGGRLTYEAQSVRYADPYTLLRVLDGLESAGDVPALERQLAAAEASLAVLASDRDYNYRLKMEMEAFIRRLEGRRILVKPGAADRLIATAAK